MKIGTLNRKLRMHSAEQRFIMWQPRAKPQGDKLTAAEWQQSGIHGNCPCKASPRHTFVTVINNWKPWRAKTAWKVAASAIVSRKTNIDTFLHHFEFEPLEDLSKREISEAHSFVDVSVAIVTCNALTPELNRVLHQLYLFLKRANS